VIHVAQDDLSSFQEDLSLGRGVDPARMSHQQRDPEFFFEVSYLKAQRRLRDPQAFSCAREASKFDDFAEGTKLTKFHLTPPPFEQDQPLARMMPDSARSDPHRLSGIILL
jgi:hypothetical protein